MITLDDEDESEEAPAAELEPKPLLGKFGF